jgi:prepilin signal peptidase PulO-like enzyme (type II secretory pathway)
MGFGGLMVWLIRIVASHSLGQEAMGFGDVTLMAMIGAFVGWQAGLIVFALSPFAALAVVFASYLITRENELAFGPYLCLAALITLMGWSTIWTRAKEQFFAVPTVLLPVLIAALVMLMFLMLAIRKLKERFSV